MGIRLGDEAPNLTAETTEGSLTFHDWKVEEVRPYLR